MMTWLNWTLLANSLLVAVIATLIASVMGLGYAIAMKASPRWLRHVLLGCAVAVLALPSFLVTNSWIDLLGVTKRLIPAFPLNVYSPVGVSWILSLLLWPIPAIACAGTWNHLEPMHFEVDSALRSRKLIRWLLWPTARGMALTSSAVVLALAACNFTVPAILQVKVFAAEAWIAFNTNLDAGAAWRLSAPLLIAPVALLLFAQQRRFLWPRASAADISTVMRRQLGVGLSAITFAVAAGLVSLGLLAPLLQLLGTSRTWNEFGPAFHAGIPALLNSVCYAAASAVLAVALGLAIARVRGMGWLWLLYFAPGILLGIAAVEWLNRPRSGMVLAHGPDRRHHSRPAACGPLARGLPNGIEFRGFVVARCRTARRRGRVGFVPAHHLATNRARGSCRWLSCLSFLPVGRGIDPDGRAPGGRNACAPHFQPASLRSQYSRERPLRASAPGRPGTAGCGHRLDRGAEGPFQGRFGQRGMNHECRVCTLHAPVNQCLPR